MKQAFTDAWQAYGKSANGKPTADGFHTFLGALPAGDPLARNVTGLAGIFDAARLVGLTDLEFAALVRAVVAPVKPDALAAADFYQSLSLHPLPLLETPAVTALK